MAKEEAVIFLVDDDELYLMRLKDHLQEKLYFKAKVFTYLTGEECIANLYLNPDIIVLDYYFSPLVEDPEQPKPMNGLELIKKIKEQRPNIHLIMLSCETNVEVANTAIQEGAKDYIVKYEFAPIQLQFLINNIILNKELNPKKNYWRQTALLGGAVFIIIILYLLFGKKPLH